MMRRLLALAVLTLVAAARRTNRGRRSLEVTLVAIESRGEDGGDVALFVRARANLLK